MINYYKVINTMFIYYRILFRTTQPAHIIAIIAVLCIVSAVVPRSDDKVNNANESHSKILSLIYLTSFILHMGSQFWMTFVSGKIINLILFLLNFIYYIYLLLLFLFCQFKVSHYILRYLNVILVKFNVYFSHDILQ